MQPHTATLFLAFILVLAFACSPDRSGAAPPQAQLDDSGIDDGTQDFDGSSGHDDGIDFDASSSDEDPGAFRDARAAPPFDAGRWSARAIMANGSKCEARSTARCRFAASTASARSAGASTRST
jgi:hypothetical protein